MTITIDVWIVIPLAVILFALGVGLYERGTRKGLESAEKLYRPLFEALEVRIDAERKDAKEK